MGSLVPDCLYARVKRIFDVVLTLLAVFFLWPLILIIAVWIKLDSKGPILFKQKRFGPNRTFFHIFKFRTMRVDTPKDVPTHLLSNPGAYITRSGVFLRKTSLDEVPQLINILKGDMSIVGPRPALHNQFDLIDARDEWGANDVPVGLTGWAQINGRDELPIAVKAALDGEYVRRRGLCFDVLIIFKTFISVFKSDGVVEGGTGSK